MDALLAEISRCTLCAATLPHPPRPVVAAHPAARVLIIGQAPGRLVHVSGVPWQDRSGERLRAWLGVDAERFYDPRCFALMPMGFCYPGAGRTGDLPPRPECAPHWHARLLAALPAVRLTVLIGRFAQAYYLDSASKVSLTDTVRGWREHLSEGRIPLPHPSPRNRVWLAHNPWFETDLLPELRSRVSAALTNP